MSQLKRSVADLVTEARQRIEEIDTEDAIALHGSANVVFVDLRDIRERQRAGFIPDSFHCPRGMVEFWVDPQCPYHKPVFAERKTFLFYCASGWRSALTVATLSEMGFRAVHLKLGFSDWKEKGGPVEKMSK